MNSGCSIVVPVLQVSGCQDQDLSRYKSSGRHGVDVKLQFKISDLELLCNNAQFTLVGPLHWPCDTNNVANVK